VGIIPSDIINPFLSADMLQIIFIAVMIGVSCGLLSDKIICFKDVLSDGYQVFSKITALIISVMPLAVFCAMAKMVLSMDLKSLFSVFAWVPTIYFGDVLMMIVYALIILLVGRLNPITFFRKYYQAMLTAFTFASSNASLHTSMATCDKSLGISKKIYSFSLPLGATINMDGSCITQIVSALFMAKIFGIPVNAPVILTLAITVFVLSVGAPGVPGGALVCISLLVPQIGIPAEAISLIMGLYSLVGMMQTCTNVTGDAAVTLVVARSEGMLEREVYEKSVRR
jgi:Na+/H+-dicarboxylate symporter